MSALLNDVATKGAKFIISCGSILRYEGKIVYADIEERSNKMVFFIKEGGARTVITKDGDELIRKSLGEFAEKYGVFCPTEESAAANNAYDIFVSRDDFVGAYITTIGLYGMLANPEEHKVVRFYEGAKNDLMKEFVLEQLIGYFDIFVSKTSKSLTMPRMPMKIRAHFVAGFFQPYYVTTGSIVCPLKWGRFSWLVSPWSDCHITLESASSSPRGLQLTCVDMSDFCSRVGVRLQTELNRKYFMCAICAACALSVDPKGAAMFMQSFPGLYEEITKNAAAGEFLADLLRREGVLCK